MPNIFDGISKMDDEKLRYQIATLETVTITNIASEVGQKTKKNTIKAANFIRGVFSDKRFEEPQVIPVEDRIADCKTSLDKLNRFDLDSRFKKILVEKVKSAGAIVGSGASNDEISVLVINAAAKNYNQEIAQNFTPAQKADAVRHRYNEKLLEQTKKSLKKQTEEERKKTEEAIQKEIDSMSEKQREELKAALGVEKLTGAAVRKMLTTAVGTTTAMIALEVSGFGAYVALTTIIHAIFTTTLGLTLPFTAYTGATSALAFITGPVGWIALAGVEIFMLNNSKKKLIYELMAQTVWGSVEAYGRKFTPKEEELPSWLPDMERNAADKESAELLNLIHENEALKEEREKLESTITQSVEAIKQYNLNINELNDKIAEAGKRNKNSQNNISELKQKLIETEARYKAEMSDGRAHIEFSTPSGFPGRIFYRVDKEHYPGKTIVVSEILKHNDAKYGK